MRRALTALLFISISAAAQSSWDRLQTLPANQTLKITLNDGSTLRGKLTSATPDRLQLTLPNGQSTQLAGSDIRRISRKSRSKGALLGGLVSFGIATPVGAYAGPYITSNGDPSAGTRFRHALGWGAFFGGVGAGIGALIGADQTIYQSSASAK